MRKRIGILSVIGFSVSAIIGLVLLYASGSGSKLPITGQTSTYATGDNGTNQTGTDFPSTRFCNNGDGTVTDNLTGLMWIQSPPTVTYNWVNALAYVTGLNSGAGTFGYTDWRMPNIEELNMLMQYEQTNLSIWLNGNGFTNVQAANYWSSTTYAPSTNYAFNVNMFYGNMIYSNKTDVCLIWPVRGGQR